uniref:Uncharacterized protein n=1 Tax=Poecilia reticulata TaxID=8081 RepID=A0A3P9PW90_POERE
MDASSEDQTKKEVKPSILSLISPQRKEPKEMCYFNSKTKVMLMKLMKWNSTDIVTKCQQPDSRYCTNYNESLRERCHGGRTGSEKSRPVALLSSSEYGRRFNSTINRTAKRHPRVALIKSDFYRKSGIIWSMAEGYGSVVPL